MHLRFNRSVPKKKSAIVKDVPRRTFDCSCGEKFASPRKLANHIAKSQNPWPLKGSVQVTHEAVSDLALISDAIMNYRRER